MNPALPAHVGRGTRTAPLFAKATSTDSVKCGSSKPELKTSDWPAELDRASWRRSRRAVDLASGRTKHGTQRQAPDRQNSAGWHSLGCRFALPGVDHSSIHFEPRHPVPIRCGRGGHDHSPDIHLLNPRHLTLSSHPGSHGNGHAQGRNHDRRQDAVPD